MDTYMDWKDEKTFRIHRTAIVMNCVIGDNVKIMAYVVIGQPGFQYARQPDGTMTTHGHQGKVIIGDNVTIHSLTHIGNGIRSGEEINGRYYGDTIIGDNTKIDCRCQIGHGTVIGKSVLICSGVVCGHNEIGDDCFIGMGALIKPRVRIGNNVMVGMGSVVIRDVPDNAVVVGNPARILRMKGG